MTGQSICVDLNGVALDTNQALHTLSCEVSGLHIPPDTFAGKRSVGQAFPSRWAGLSGGIFNPEHWQDAKWKFFEHPDMFHRLAAPVAGAVETLTALSEKGNDIFLISDVKRLQLHHIEMWWKRAGFPHCEKILSRPEPKLDLCGCCEIIIDDKLKNLTPHLARSSVPTLIHFIPAQGSVGSAAARSDDRRQDPRILTAVGWEGVQEILLKPKAAAA